MKKEELKELIDYWYEQSKRLLAMQHDYKMQEIRLETSNKRKIEEFKADNMADYYKRKYGGS